MSEAFRFRQELKEKTTLASLMDAFRAEVKDKQSNELLSKTPDEIFTQMKNDNEIRGEYVKLEFLKLKKDDLAVITTDIHGDEDKQQKVLDYINTKKEEISGEIHLIDMGDIVSGASGSEENINALFNLLEGSRNGDFKLHLLQGNVEKNVPPVSGLYEKIKETENDVRAFIAMTDLFKSLPNSLFLQAEKDNIMLGHSTLPLINQKKFEESGLKIYNKNAEEIDRLGIRESSATWATFDGEREKSEYGGKKMFQLGKNTFQSILKTLNLKRILRGHDSALIKDKAKNTGVHQLFLEDGEVDTFHTSKKATEEFGIFAEISGKGDIEFKKV